MKGLLPALQFLTIIPVRIGGNLTEKDIARSSAFFPVAGALQGLILLISAILFSGLFPSDIAAAFIIVIAVLCNGGFHLDGLSDTFDALAVKSAGDPATDRERRLAVMKDSHAGVIGIVAVILAILLKFVLINNILSGPTPFSAYLIIFLMPVFSKWIMVPAMFHGSAARKNGLGRIFIEGVTIRLLICSYAFIIIILGGVTAAQVWLYHGLNSALLFIILPAGHILALACAGACHKIFGGLTGDTLGALSELSEIFFLTGAYIWQQHCI
jgi:adenosylcobinamide-GDP ribazoletransferase